MLSRFGAVPLAALCDLVADSTRLFATFPELDHYGERADAQYIGPLLGRLKAPRVDWPAEGGALKVFACLRPDTSNVRAILSALGSLEARIVCVASGFSRKQIQPRAKRHIRFSSMPIDLEPLLDADLCVTYGAEGTMMRFLMAGVPQLVSPWHVETYMAVRRIESNGLGIHLPDNPDAQSVVDLIGNLLANRHLKDCAGNFSRRSKLTSNDPSGSITPQTERAVT